MEMSNFEDKVIEALRGLKSDFCTLKSDVVDIRSDLSNLKKDVHEDFTALKKDVREDIRGMKADIRETSPSKPSTLVHGSVAAGSGGAVVVIWELVKNLVLQHK